MNPDPSNWVDEYGDYLFSIAMLKTGSREVAEDLVQDTFLSAIKNLDGFRNESTVKTWLTAILQNKIIDHYRKKGSQQQTDEYLSGTADSFYQSFFQEDEYSSAHWKKESQPHEWDNPADRELQYEEFIQVFQLCIQKMPPRLVPVFIARFVDDKESEEICKELGLTSSNYWVLIHRAKLVIRACLDKNWINN